MKSILQWAIAKTPAMNTLLASVMAVGMMAIFALRREEFPRFELEIILVQVPYPGASPDDVESGICQKIEEAVRSIDGIKKVMSIAREGSGNVVIELNADVPDVQKVLNEVETEVDRISTFPRQAEQPEIQQLTIRDPAIKVGVVADRGDTSPGAELQLRDVVERTRDDLLLIPEISVANIQGERDYQIDVEISETTLRKYGLSLQEVANRIGQQNIELPGGKIRDRSQVLLLRAKHKRLWGREIAHIPLVTSPGGVVLTVGDLGAVRDHFVDTTSISRINGKPGMALSVEAAAGEDLLAMTRAVREYVRTASLPYGYHFEVWDDRSINVQERLDLLKRNGLQGLVLVFLVLALFLDLRLSFWVALGIPVSVFGACAVLWQFDQTLNMLSMFSFLIALGIVVDDGIVVGENIYAHRQRGKDFVQAAVDGAAEVLPSVAASVATTVFAFVPMFFVSGVMGKFFAVLPMAVIAMLVISVFEATLILPCHLAHDSRHAHGRTLADRARVWRSGRMGRGGPGGLASLLVVIASLIDPVLEPFRWIGWALRWVNGHFGVLLDWVIFRFYTPLLRYCLRRPTVPICTSVALLLASLALVRNGTVPWIIFPKLDARQIQATVIFPDGTPARITEAATESLEDAILAIDRRHRRQDGPVVRLTYRLVGQVASQSVGGAADLTEGSHAGAVYVELIDNKLRRATSQQLIDQWRREVGRIAGAESVSFRSVSMGPGGRPIEFKLLAPARQMKSMEQAVEACKHKLARYPGVLDIADDSRPGKWEFQLQLKKNARDLGVPLSAVAQSVRAAYYGQEVMRLQRGRHEVKLMVRYPSAERRSIGQFHDLRVDTGDGVKRPITELAQLHVAQGYSEINRLDQMRSITITADVDESRANAAAVVADLKAHFMPELLKEYPQLHVRWEGQQEQTVESIHSLFVGLVIALLAMYVLLTFEFTSYTQPAIIMVAIPFGIMGAVWGHAVMGLPLTLFSVLGLVALTGIVVNDSIVLVDFVNLQLDQGVPLRRALLESGQRRFRPVLLTSLTTIAGMLPLLTETSMQAQILIPMANSLCFGLVCSTALVLVLVPSLYVIYGRLTGRGTADTIDNAPADPPLPGRRWHTAGAGDTIGQDEHAPHAVQDVEPVRSA